MQAKASFKQATNIIGHLAETNLKKNQEAVVATKIRRKQRLETQ